MVELAAKWDNEWKINFKLYRAFTNNPIRNFGTKELKREKLDKLSETSSVREPTITLLKIVIIKLVIYTSINITNSLFQITSHVWGEEKKFYILFNIL